jgi:hypothetical protein
MKDMLPTLGHPDSLSDAAACPAELLASVTSEGPWDQLRYHLEAVKRLAADTNQLEAIKTHMQVCLKTPTLWFCCCHRDFALVHSMFLVLFGFGLGLSTGGGISRFCTIGWHLNHDVMSTAGLT